VGALGDFEPVALVVLAAIPSARAVAFQRERLSKTYWEAGSWIAGIVLFDHYVCGWIRRKMRRYPQQC
jgi:hypothetical protein